MSMSRRTAIASIGALGGTVALGTTAYAVDEHVGGGDSNDTNDSVSDGYDDADDAESAIRVAHFAPDAPNVDVLVDDEQFLSNVAYGTVSDYLPVEPGTYTVTITAAGDPETVAFEGDVTVEDAFYTVAAVGELDAETFEALVLEDETEAPDDAALVRLVHASPDAPAVDVSADGTTLAENLAFGDATDYLEVPAGAYTVEVSPASDQTGDTGDEAADADENATGDGAMYERLSASASASASGDGHAGGMPADGNETGHDHGKDGVTGNESKHDRGTDDDSAMDPSTAGPVATFDVEVEAGTAYTGYAIGYLDPEAAGAEADRELALEVTIDGESAPADDVDEEATDPVETEPTEDDENATDDTYEDDENATDDMYEDDENATTNGAKPTPADD